MADFNQILSLLKDQNIKTPTTSTQSQVTASSDQSILPAGLDLSNINPSVISQVRQEYLSKKTLEDKLKNATTITPEVLVAIGNMVKETNIIQVLRKCKERQDQKERELYSHRESIKERYKKQKENVLAKELIGVKVDPNETKAIQRDLNRELHRMDLQIIKDMDGEIKYLQQEFVKLNVPLFKVTNNPNDIKLQQKVLFMLQDMI